LTGAFCGLSVAPAALWEMTLAGIRFAAQGLGHRSVEGLALGFHRDSLFLKVVLSWLGVLLQQYGFCFKIRSVSLVLRL
jgi:hypothetical protein